VFRVLAVPVAVLLVLLLALRVFLGSAGTQTSVDQNDVVRACGREFFTPLAEDRSFVKLMRKDCGIYGPQAARN
jgi:hypothetical protein